MLADSSTLFCFNLESSVNSEEAAVGYNVKLFLLFVLGERQQHTEELCLSALDGVLPTARVNSRLFHAFISVSAQLSA